MARPRSFDRDEALMTALHLFWENGYEQTTTARLASAMKVSPPSIYAAFGDKRKLFDEAVAAYEASPASILTNGLREPTPRRMFERMLELAVKEYSSDLHPHGCLVNSEPRLGANRWHNRELVAAALRQMDAPHKTPDGLVDAVAAYVVAVLTGLSSLARDGATAELLRLTADVALRGWPART